MVFDEAISSQIQTADGYEEIEPQSESVYLKYTEMLFPTHAQENYMFLEVLDF
jgi:hypothetical protein